MRQELASPPQRLGGCKRDGEKEERGSAEKESEHNEFEQRAGVVAMSQCGDLT